MRRVSLPQVAATLVAAGISLFGCASPLMAVPAPNANSVLILGPTVFGGAASVEAVEAGAAGYTVVVVDAATWGTTTALEFATYRALILGDARCTGVAAVAAAVANSAVWSPAVDGNIILIGTDEVYHDSEGGRQVTINAIKFAANSTTKTGLMCSLSCYYAGTVAPTPVQVLFGIGFFEVQRPGGCFDDAHIVATHPALVGLTDASLSNWGCSVHEVFLTYPADFIPLAIAEDPTGRPALPGSKSFPDGTSGVPYILARGEGLVLISDITLTPPTADNPVGTIHTVTATVTQNTPTPDSPVVGTTVTFLVTSGPNAGATGTAVTDAFGQATFSYTGTGGVGTDIINATFVDAESKTQTSNNVLKNWVTPPNTPPDVSNACPSLACLWPPNHKFVPITIGCVTDAEGDPITINVLSITSDEPTTSVAGAGGPVHSPDAAGVGTSTASLRAERTGTNVSPQNGRVYEIIFSASDGKDSSIGSVRVNVPHDQRDKTCFALDNGQVYDATVNN